MKVRTNENKMFIGDNLAKSVWKSKYAVEGETHYDQMHLRMAKEFARIDAIYQIDEVAKIISYENNSLNLSNYGSIRKNLTTDAIYNLFKDFKNIVPQGSIMSQCGNNDQIGSLSNCFVIGQPEDSYGGIMLKDQELVQLMKRRGGVGIDISTLRPNNTPTSNAAKTSTGAVSFMERFSNSTREVAQNGRRGALMLSIDVRHPDVADFVGIKADKTKVTGANISVSLRDDFMKAVKADKDYILRFPINADISRVDSDLFILMKYDELTKITSELSDVDENIWIKKIKAKELYDLIIKNAWENAEPGQIFIDRHWDYSPDGVYPQYKGITTNPCGEIFMQPYDACRLMAINFYSFVINKFTNKAYIDYDKLYQVAYEQQRLADNLVDLELEKIIRILNKIKSDTENLESRITEINLWKRIYEVAFASRRTGCGFTGLGDMIAAMGVDYDSEEGMNIIDEVMKTKMMAELDCTIDLAILRGPFEGYDNSIEYVDGVGQNSYYKFLKKNFKAQYNRMIDVGRRNISTSTVAPTGSVSILTQTTSGLEPVFSVFPYIRRKKINSQDVGIRIDFTDENGDQWQEFSVTHKGLMDYIGINKLDSNITELYESLNKTKEDEEKLVKMVVDFISKNKTPYSNSSANDIDWINRVKIQSIIQKYTSHSISSTINLPEDVKESEVSEIYLTAWDLKLKGVTVYRDGSRSGVLVSNDTKQKNKFEYKDAIKRPKILKAETHYSTSKGENYHVIIGLLDGNPYEIFIDDSDNRYSSKGKIIKEGRGKYIFKNGGDPVEIKNYMTDEQQAITRLVSANLRHGTDIKFIVEQLQKINGNMFSFTKSLARVLKKYIPEGVKASGITCNSCGSNDIIFEEGCHKCRSCGNSKCG